jgi:simple sugar transport system ATP-binding protein
LELVNITKHFPGVLANDHINLQLRAGEIHALLGENGAGKTTLMNILYGLLRPDEGEIRIRGRPCHIGSPREAITHGIGMVHQHFMLVPTLTVADNIMLGHEPVSGPFLRRVDATRRIQQLADDYGLNVSPTACVWQLSVGEQQRVEILKVLYRGAQLLILDEPTASLTPQETSCLFDILRSMVAHGKSVIFISHKLEEVMAISDRITVLRQGRVVGSVNRTDTSDRALACMMVGREVVLRVTGHHGARVAGAPAARLEVVSAFGNHQRLALEEVSLSLHGGEIVGVAGVDGNGQTELAEVIAGLRAPVAGTVWIGDRRQPPVVDAAQRIDLGVAYVPAERKRRGAVMSLPITMNAILKNHRRRPQARRGILNHSVVRAFAEQLISAYDIRGPGSSAAAETLSGGNLQKLILAREISSQPCILIAEQPSRGLDVGAIEYVQGLLLQQRERGCAVLLISADLDEILALSDRIVVMYRGQIVYEVDNVDAPREQIGLAMAGKYC